MINRGVESSFFPPCAPPSANNETNESDEAMETHATVLLGITAGLIRPELVGDGTGLEEVSGICKTIEGKLLGKQVR